MFGSFACPINVHLKLTIQQHYCPFPQCSAFTGFFILHRVRCYKFIFSATRPSRNPLRAHTCRPRFMQGARMSGIQRRYTRWHGPLSQRLDWSNQSNPDRVWFHTSDWLMRHGKKVTWTQDYLLAWTADLLRWVNPNVPSMVHQGQSGTLSMFPMHDSPFSPTWIPSIPNAVRDAWQSWANTSWREANSFDQSEFCLQPS